MIRRHHLTSDGTFRLSLFAPAIVQIWSPSFRRLGNLFAAPDVLASKNRSTDNRRRHGAAEEGTWGSIPSVESRGVQNIQAQLCPPDLEFCHQGASFRPQT